MTHINKVFFSISLTSIALSPSPVFPIGFLWFLLRCLGLFCKYRLHLFHFLHTNRTHYRKCPLSTNTAAIAVGLLNLCLFVLFFLCRFISNTFVALETQNVLTGIHYSHVCLMSHSQPRSASQAQMQMPMYWWNASIFTDDMPPTHCITHTSIDLFYLFHESYGRFNGRSFSFWRIAGTWVCICIYNCKTY